MGNLDQYINHRVNRTRQYEKAHVSDKTSLEEFLLDPMAWVRMLVVAFFAPSTLFKSVKYGGSIGLPSVLFLLLNSYYCTALLHTSGTSLKYSILGAFYISVLGLFFWALCSMFLHQIRKKMAVHPRFQHFLRFAVWNQLILFWPITIAYIASFYWFTSDIILAALICFSLGYSVYGFINVFKPRSLVAPMATVICSVSLFASLSVVVGLRGVDGEHTELTAWMDPKVAVPRLEYHYHNEKRVMIARYQKWKSPDAEKKQKPSLASN